MKMNWPPMSISEYAAFKLRLEGHVLNVGGTYWSQVKPFFYRPLLPFRGINQQDTVHSFPLLNAGYQHAATKGQHFNSWIDVIWFRNLQGYAPSLLSKKKRRQLAIAKENIDLRLMDDLKDFQNQAYPVYLSFHQRTLYRYLSDRRDKKIFNIWAKRLFEFKKVVVLGAYYRGVLGAVSITELVDDVVIYSSFFSNDILLRHHVADLMLHTIRSSAADHEQAKIVFAGMCKGNNGLDYFYTSRGGECSSLPANLSLNPLASILIRYIFPGRYRQLMGGHSFSRKDASVMNPS